MASKGLAAHRLALRKIMVEGELQPIDTVAHLTLRDEDPDKHVMKVHVDGKTLGTWDLSTVADLFHTDRQDAQLQFTLPLVDENGQHTLHGGDLRVVQLFLRHARDFATVVNYLSEDAGLQHCPIKDVLGKLRDTRIPWTTQSQPQEPFGAFDMGPPMQPPVRAPSRLPSAHGFYPPSVHSRALSIHRPQTAIPHPMSDHGRFARPPSRAGTITPGYERIPAHGYGYPLRLPRDSYGFRPDGSTQNRQSVSRHHDLGGFGEGVPQYEPIMRRASIASRPPSSHPVRGYRRNSMASTHEVLMSTEQPLNGFSNEVLDGDLPIQTGRTSPSALSVNTSGTYLYSQRPSSATSSVRPPSRPLSVAAKGVPIKIQVIDPAAVRVYPYSHPKTRWEFTLHILPVTKVGELCLHAADHIRRNFQPPVDGFALAAQSRNGDVLDDQKTVPMEVVRGETLFLIDRRALATTRSIPTNLVRSSLDPLSFGWTSDAGNIGVSHPASSIDPYAQCIEESNRVPPPPPRQVPFSVTTTANRPRSSSSATAAESPPIPKPVMRTVKRPGNAKNHLGPPVNQSASQDSVAKKEPGGSQRRRGRPALKRPATAIENKIDSAPAVPQASQLPARKRRPETALGISRKRKTPLNDEGPSALTPLASVSITTGATATEQQELAATTCIGCRRKKRKCDRFKPACGSCLKDNRQCIYPNIQETAVTSSTAAQEGEREGLVTLNLPGALRNRTLAPLPVIQEASTQTSPLMETRDAEMQTQEDKGGAAVEMKDEGTITYHTTVDTSTETSRCSEIWLPFSQSVELTVRASRRHDEQLQKAVEILNATDPSQEDYQNKVEQAGMCYVEFIKELQEKCEKAFR